MAAKKVKPKKRLPVLIVEDTGMVRQTLMRILRMGQFDVLEASNAEEAVRQLAVHEVGLIILDINMPGVDGITLCGMLKQAEKTRSVPIIMCTAMAEKSFIVRAMQAGAMDYILKPFEAAVVLQKVVKVYGESTAKPAPKKAEEKDSE
jgi:DNA-binding response OmpR family regulator